MEKESIDKVIGAMFVALDVLDIDAVDKFEFKKNLYAYLRNYEENNVVLSMYQAKRRYDNVQTICDRTTEDDRHERKPR